MPPWPASPAPRGHPLHNHLVHLVLDTAVLDPQLQQPRLRFIGESLVPEVVLSRGDIPGREGLVGKGAGELQAIQVVYVAGKTNREPLEARGSERSPPCLQKEEEERLRTSRGRICCLCPAGSSAWPSPGARGADASALDAFSFPNQSCSPLHHGY